MAAESKAEFEYELLENDTYAATILSVTENLVIPSDYNGKKVTELTSDGEYIDGRNRVVSVTIPNSITTIGYQSLFELRSLKNIEIPNSVTKIEDFAFGYCASLSGALNVAARTPKAGELDEWRGIFGFSLESSAELKGTDHDLFAIAARNQAAGVAFPKLFMWCGTEDRLLEANRLFDAHLTDLAIPHLYQESEGNHSWKWWDLHIRDALSYLLEKNV